MLLRCCIIICLAVAALGQETIIEHDIIQNPIRTLFELDEFINRVYYNETVVTAWRALVEERLVNTTSRRRPNMEQHQVGIYRLMKTDSKAITSLLMWQPCISSIENELNDCQTSYLNCESGCVNTANNTYEAKLEFIRTEDEKIQQLRLIYNSYSDICTPKNPDNQEVASRCLREIVDREQFLSRLEEVYFSKLNAIVDVQYHKINNILEVLEECLRPCFTYFVEQDAELVRKLDLCHTRLTHPREE